MNLPALLVLAEGGPELVGVVERAVAGGARAVVLRQKSRSRAERAAMAGLLRPLLAEAGGLLLVASDAALSAEVGADGVHLAAADAFPAPRPAVVGRSCHDRASLGAAAAEGCDYATLSPIFATFSKPGYGPALGPGALAGAPLPTFALGGVTAANAGACLAAGAAGVAVMGAVMTAPDPALAVRDLLAALAGAGG